jgi:hypothetical protein
MRCLLLAAVFLLCGIAVACAQNTVLGGPLVVSGGIVPTQNVVTGSRVIGTTYQNTTGRNMFVNVIIQNTVAGQLVGITDSAASPTTQVWEQYVNNINATVTMIVLPGNYYKVTAGGTNALAGWIEWY